jgi:hypothetical protein
MPGLALIGLYRVDEVESDPRYGIYCALMLPAMVAAMLLSPDKYREGPNFALMSG